MMTSSDIVWGQRSKRVNFGSWVRLPGYRVGSWIGLRVIGRCTRVPEDIRSLPRTLPRPSPRIFKSRPGHSRGCFRGTPNRDQAVVGLVPEHVTEEMQIATNMLPGSFPSTLPRSFRSRPRRFRGWFRARSRALFIVLNETLT